MAELKRLSIFSTPVPEPTNRSKICFRRKPPSPASSAKATWRDKAKRRRTDPVNPKTLASNAASYALCASLLPVLETLERNRHTPSAAAAGGVIDALIEAAESDLGVDAPVMGPLTELLKLIESWQREHLVDETTLVEVMLARVAIGLQQTAGVDLKDVLRRPFERAFDGLPPSLRP